MSKLSSLISSAVASIVMFSAAGTLQAQIPVLADGSVAMGHLHLLVSEADFDAHRSVD